MTDMTERYNQGLALVPQFANVGILALYGGTKGHGYWLYRATAEERNAFIQSNGWAGILGKVITNDGTQSGNPRFWLYNDAKALLDKEATP